MHTILSYFAYKILVYNIVSMTSSPIYQKEKKNLISDFTLYFNHNSSYW